MTQDMDLTIHLNEHSLCVMRTGLEEVSVFIQPHGYRPSDGLCIGWGETRQEAIDDARVALLAAYDALGRG